ncbi:hypothetical protein Ahy_A06g026945 isoform A [Arachis hypogaea]|uniref:Uncharacterized protein n=1 Tax=Arachis hypogaea TaxID=3818 RepID=A0A445CM67_ARAHY|nr:hypothetical protein Ahy_A06g026945 isoform A [Arachis hypogaea]
MLFEVLAFSQQSLPRESDRKNDQISLPMLLCTTGEEILNTKMCLQGLEYIHFLSKLCQIILYLYISCYHDPTLPFKNLSPC